MIWRKEQFLGSGRFLPWGCGCSIALCLHLSLLPTRDSVLILGHGKRVVGGNYKKFIRLPRSARFAFMTGLSAPSATGTEIRALLVSVRLSLLSPDLLTLPCVRPCLSPILISMYRLGQVFSKTNSALPL